MKPSEASPKKGAVYHAPDTRGDSVGPGNVRHEWLLEDWVGKSIETVSTSLLNIKCEYLFMFLTNALVQLLFGLNTLLFILIVYFRKQSQTVPKSLKSRRGWGPLSLATQPAVSCRNWRVKLQWQWPASRALKVGYATQSKHLLHIPSSNKVITLHYLVLTALLFSPCKGYRHSEKNRCFECCRDDGGDVPRTGM